MLRPMSSVTCDDLGQPALDALVHALAQLGRQVAPQIGVLTLDDALGELADVVAGGGEDVLGDRVGLEPAVELARAAELGDPLVDPRSSPSSRPGTG